MFFFVRTCNVLPWRAFVLCNLCGRLQHCSIFPSKNRLRFLPYLFVRSLRSFCAFHICGRSFLPFCRSLRSKRLQRSFHTVFRAVLGVYLFRAYICTVCVVSCVCIALFAANLPFCGVGVGLPPKGRRREAQLR